MPTIHDRLTDWHQKTSRPIAIDHRLWVDLIDAIRANEFCSESYCDDDDAWEILAMQHPAVARRLLEVFSLAGGRPETSVSSRELIEDAIETAVVRIAPEFCEQLRIIFAKLNYELQMHDAGGEVGLFLESDLNEGGRYLETPVNVVPFASVGADGQHYSALITGGEINEDCPIVLTAPGSCFTAPDGTETANMIVGDSLRDFLNGGCMTGWCEYWSLCGHDYQELLAADPSFLWPEKIAVLEAMRERLNLSPWHDPAKHSQQLASDHFPKLIEAYFVDFDFDPNKI